MSWAVNINSSGDTPVIFDDEDEVELKLHFAREVVKCGADWRMAGYRVFQGQDNLGRAMQAANWINDAIVTIEIDRIRNSSDPSETMPTKEQFVAEIWSRAKLEGDSKASAPLYKIVAEVMKFIEPGGTKVHVGDIVQNVLRVPERSVDKVSFAERFKASQTKLVTDARSNRTA
jgi:hypothetical protein